MKKTLLLAVLLITRISFGQVPIIEWQRSLGGSSWDEAGPIQQTTDGGYIVAGSSESNDGDVSKNNGSSDYWIVKLNSEVGITELSPQPKELIRIINLLGKEVEL